MIPPFYIFLTMGAGVAKSHLNKNMFLSVSKLLLYKIGSKKTKKKTFIEFH